jgi:nucleotide-binding universal stress UspA family protein
MISLKNILVPTDFSDSSKKALAYGLTLAGAFNSNLILVHVAPEPSATLTRDIEALLPADYNAPSNLRTIIKTGNVEDELLMMVKNEAIDMVVMGTHSRRLPERWFLGSVTEHILRKVPVPVLTVSGVDPTKDSRGFVALKNILYATDLSESSRIGMEYAIELARKAAASLAVLHVIDNEDRMLWGPAILTDIDRPKIVEEFRLKLHEFVSEERVPDVAMEGFIAEGKPFSKIIEFADERNVDIIVLNMQSKGVLDRVILGSTAERVVRLARVPVLSVPTSRSEEKNE